MCGVCVRERERDGVLVCVGGACMRVCKCAWLHHREVMCMAEATTMGCERENARRREEKVCARERSRHRENVFV